MKELKSSNKSMYKKTISFAPSHDPHINDP